MEIPGGNDLASIRKYNLKCQCKLCAYKEKMVCKLLLTGLSVPEFISVVMTPRTKSIVSCAIP